MRSETSEIKPLWLTPGYTSLKPYIAWPKDALTW